MNNSLILFYLFFEKGENLNGSKSLPLSRPPFFFLSPHENDSNALFLKVKFPAYFSKSFKETRVFPCVKWQNQKISSILSALFFVETHLDSSTRRELVSKLISIYRLRVLTPP